MLCACLASGYRATDAFIASMLQNLQQKHLFREMRLHNTPVHDKDALQWTAITRRWGMNKSGEADDGVDDEPNPEGVEGGERRRTRRLSYQRRITLRSLHCMVISVGREDLPKRDLCVSVVVVSVTGLTGVFNLPSPRI